MSTGSATDASDPCAILRGAIEQQRQMAARANAELENSLASLRERLFAPPDPLPVPDDAHGIALVLLNGRWGNEVALAAGLDNNFRQTVGAEARRILQAHGLLPAEPDTGPTGPSN